VGSHSFEDNTTQISLTAITLLGLITPALNGVIFSLLA